MPFFPVLLVLLTMVVGQLAAPATIVANNVAGVSFVAAFGAGAGPLTGSVVGTSGSGGVGIGFDVSINGFPVADVDTNYTYHIHEFPVPTDGNCSGTGGHFDPNSAGKASSYVCTPSTDPSLCELGDLSGKHGKIDSAQAQIGAFSASYLDKYLSTTEGSVAFFGNRSLVVHGKNGVRIDCGNFTSARKDQTLESTTTTAATPSRTTSYLGIVVSTSGFTFSTVTFSSYQIPSGLFTNFGTLASSNTGVPMTSSKSDTTCTTLSTLPSSSATLLITSSASVASSSTTTSPSAIVSSFTGIAAKSDRKALHLVAGVVAGAVAFFG